MCNRGNLKDLFPVQDIKRGFPGGARDKEPACQRRRHKRPGLRSLGWQDPLEEEVTTHSSILAWRIPWTERSLAGYSAQGRKELDMTERLSTQDIKQTHPSYKDMFPSDPRRLRRVLLWVQFPKSHSPKGRWLTEAPQSCFLKSQSVMR